MHFLKFKALLAQVILYSSTIVNAVQLDINDESSICSAAKVIADGEWNYYEGTKRGGTVGMFSSPYYWWHAGEAFGGLLDYYMFCDRDNDTLKSLISDGMSHQSGSNYDYIPGNQSTTEGNDDQGVWGMTIMDAVERNLTDPGEHGWLSMAQAIFNTMNNRWDTESCGGGLRWQIFTWNSGYDYKNAIANGCLFHIAARLARYTHTENYTVSANKIWDWMEEVGFLYRDGDELTLLDGAKVEDDCSKVTRTKWSYTYGIFLSGAAYMYNVTNNDTWRDRVDELLQSSLENFFDDRIMVEKACAPSNCNTDQRTFRSLFSRCLMLTMEVAPHTVDTILPYIQASAQGAAGQCSGGEDGVTCGAAWANSTWDGTYGLGEQMAALEVILALLPSVADDIPGPYSNDTGGTSRGDAHAGLDTNDEGENKNEISISTRDKAGAGVLTGVVLAILLGGAIWMVL